MTSRRWLPYPLLSATLLLVWLLLNNTLAPGQVLLGALLGLAVPAMLRALRGRAPRVRAGGVILRLGVVVLLDIVVSNFEVARRILGREARLMPRFFWVPLDLRDEHGLAVLGSIITLTPGTLTADITPDRRHLLVHGLHVPDPEAAVAQIKQRYESPLREVFG